jgi:glycine betaine/proline transport system permease protein
MVGCTERQMTWRVMVPAARESLMVGMNQVIMLSLNMVIIASMIGAGGLGFDVLTALAAAGFRRRARGRLCHRRAGHRAGPAVQAAAEKLSHPSPAACTAADAGVVARHPYTSCRRLHWSSSLALSALATVLPACAPFQRPGAHHRHFWSRSSKWININYFDTARSHQERAAAQRDDPVQALSGQSALGRRGGAGDWLCRSAGGWRLALLTLC